MKTDPIRDMIRDKYNEKIDQIECQGCADKIRAVAAARDAELKRYDDTMLDAFRWKIFLSRLREVDISQRRNDNGDLEDYAKLRLESPKLTTEYAAAQANLQTMIDTIMMQELDGK